MSQVKLVEFFNEHWYKLELEGQTEPLYFASPTTKLQVVAKPFLATWRGDIGNREADMRIFESQQSGIRIHHAFYSVLMGCRVIYNPLHHPLYTEDDIKKLNDSLNGQLVVMRYQDEYLDVVKLQKWLEIVNPEVVAAEKTVYSLKHRDAGTMDVLFKIKKGTYAVNGKTPLVIHWDGLYVTDLKTGNSVDDNADWQTACYSNCVEEMGLGAVDGTIILHTGSKLKTGIPGLATNLRTKEQVKEDFEMFRTAARIWEYKNADRKPETFQFPSEISWRHNPEQQPKEIEMAKKVCKPRTRKPKGEKK